MRRNRKSTILLLLGILALGLTLGYAYLNTTLNIDGTVNVSSANWNVYWDNIQFSSNNVTDVTTPATISTGKTEVTFNVNFKEPGDSYEFTVDAVNDGSIDAMIDTVTTGVYASDGVTEKGLPDYLEYETSYDDDVEIEQNHILAAGTREKYRILVYYNKNIDSEDLPSTADNYMFKFGINYIQKSSSGIPKPEPTYTYTISSRPNRIGNTIRDELKYDNYQDAIEELGHNVFLKHKLINNRIVESSVGFVLNGQDYYLKGAEKATYEENKEILNSIFGSSNCTTNSDGLYGNYYSCTSGELTVIATTDGYVQANEGTPCFVDETGISYCGFH